MLPWKRNGTGLSGVWGMFCFWAICVSARGGEAVFFRGLNLNGPAVRIDGRAWEGTGADGVVISGKTFENQGVALRPPTDPDRARMIRSSVWGSKVDIEVGRAPEGEFQIFVYVWEDNHSEQFDLWINDRPVLEKVHSGSAGTWKKLGPWKTASVGGRLKISARTPSHGAANVSGIEIWSGAGAIPAVKHAEFLETWTPAQQEFFEARVRPVLAEHCYECHSARAAKVKGGLVLDSRAGVRKGGDTGAVVAPGDPEASLLIQAVRQTDPNLTMPPKGKLSSHQIEALEEWVRMGAPDPRGDDTVAATAARSSIDWGKARQWWSFREARKPALPAVRRADWPANEVDRFTLARMEAAGLAPAADADRTTWIRRVTYDLTGLPPLPEEVDAYLNDRMDGAEGRVVDRLLASPRYGERWGRHWLDVVRYSDTAGDNSDFPIPQMRRYRDWVIGALNRDLRYDQFVREQLAGDLMPAEGEDDRFQKLIATGYVANARRFGSRVDDYPQHLTIEDTLDNLGKVFLGLTVNCARCHNHKFDPITTEDYYGLYGIFHSTRYPWPGIELEQRQRDLVPLVAGGDLGRVMEEKKTREAEQRRLRKEAQRLKDLLKDTKPEEKKAVESQIAEAERVAKEFSLKPLGYELAYAVGEGERAEDAAVQVKGDPSKVGAVVRRRFLTVLGGAELPAGVSGSGRLQLAEWVASPTNPLTARVMVNRMWQGHFGRGLVATPNDFGRQGKAPTHPELLDWLAVRFVDSGWSMKAMHRLMVLSRTYRVSGERSEGVELRDPANERYTFFPRRRLDAESIRDALLVLGGNMEWGAGGAHPFPPEHEWKFTQHNPFKAVYGTDRRSVYLMTQRIQRHPYLAIFDGADPSASTAVRTASTTPLQALYFLNDGWVHEQCRKFAERVMLAAPGEAARMEWAYQRAMSRRPDSDEVDQGREFLAKAREEYRGRGRGEAESEREAWFAWVRVLFRLNEFVYID